MFWFPHQSNSEVYLNVDIAVLMLHFWRLSELFKNFFFCGKFILSWTLRSKCKLYLTQSLAQGSRDSRSSERLPSQGSERQSGKSKECEITLQRCQTGAAQQQVQIDYRFFRAHLSDWRVISLAGGYIDESGCKELFQPQVVVQDHLEQGTLTGRQLGSNRVCNTVHLTHPHRYSKHEWESTPGGRRFCPLTCSHNAIFAFGFGSVHVCLSGQSVLPW